MGRDRQTDRQTQTDRQRGGGKRETDSTRSRPTLFMFVYFGRDRNSTFLCSQRTK